MAEDFEASQDDDDFEDSPLFMQEADFDDEFDSLRRRSVRASSAFDDMEQDVDDEDVMAFSEEDSRSSGFSFGNFSPGQRLVLMVLVLLDIVAVVIGLLVVTGRFSL